MTIEGRLIGVPVHHATQGLFYNEALLEERVIVAIASSEARRCGIRSAMPSVTAVG